MENVKRIMYSWVTGHKKLIIALFAVMVCACALMKPLVKVNYDMKDYLPENSTSTVALKVMQKEYEEGVPNVRLMISDVSVPEALEYKDKIEKIDGVDSVVWLDDSVNPAIPVASMDDEILDEYYKDENAIMQITVDEDKILTAVSEIEEVADTKGALTGDAVSTSVATKSTVSEILLITVLAVVMVFLILLFATESWLEPLLILITIGAAIVINGGTNIIFGEISFVTNAAGSVLQLAVSLDYAVFLLHRYHEYRLECDDPREAMIEALCKSTNSILSSGVTTVIGFMALVLMRFLIGPDIGWALAKGIAISLITVFVLLPALFLQFEKAVDKFRHKDLLPSFNKMGKLIVKIMLPCVIVFVLAIAPSYLASNSNSYYYGAGEIFGSDTKLGQDTEKIEEVFGQRDTYALLLPQGDISKEKSISEEIGQLPQVTGVVSYVDTVGAEIPYAYLDEETFAKLNSDNYTRMVISTDTGTEGEEVFELVENIMKIAGEYYSDDFYLAGSGPTNYDLMDTITEDMVKVNLIAIAAVYLVLLIMMKSFVLPFLLVLSIETAIWINTAVPYFADEPIFYIAYLIISTVQLGATVDYAILFTDRYKECRGQMNKKEAVIETVEWTVPSILVSGLTLTIVGTLLGNISTHGLLAQLGVFIGRGAVCSMMIVFFVLPGLLYLFDKLYINRGKRRMKKLISCMIAVMLVAAAFAPVASYADSIKGKEEVVYGNLLYDGSVEKVYAVNIFDDESVTDYGDYTEIKNLTTSDKVKYEDGKVTVSATETPFYYEGSMAEAGLPWEIDIKYYLDGEEVEAENLAGESGELEIVMSVKQNGECSSFFFENYALQIAVMMDGNYCRNIEAEGATIANVGSDKQITYTVLPGKGTDIKIKADVTSFEMDEISINGIKLNMDVDMDTSELMSEANRLEEGSVALDEGTSDIKNGAKEVKAGTEQVHAGIIELMQNCSYNAYKTVMKDNGLDIDQLKQGNIAVADQIKKMLAEYGENMEPQDKAMYEQIVSIMEGNIAMIEGTETYLGAINEKMGLLESGTANLTEGAAELYSGTKELKDGTEEFREETSGIDNKINTEIDDIKNEITGTNEVRSFTSEKNKNVKSVQFVLKTKPILMEEAQVEESAKEEQGFWQKLLDLFR